MALTKIKTDGIADEAVTLAKHAPTGSDGQVLTSTGAGTDPAFENILTNGSDNRVVTASSSTTLNGESTLTYSDPELKIDTTSARGKVKLDGTSGGEIIFTKDGTEKLHIYNSEQETRIESAAGAANLMVKAGTDTDNYAQLQLYPAGTGVSYIASHKDLVIWDGANGVAHTTFKLGGDIQTTGGISFNPHVDDSASSPYSNVLDDYEEGTFVPEWGAYGNSPNDGEFTYHVNDAGITSQQGNYVKIGKHVTCWFYINYDRMTTIPSGSYVRLKNLPFTVTQLNANHYGATEGATLLVNWKNISGGGEGGGGALTGFAHRNHNHILFGHKTQTAINACSPTEFFGSSTITSGTTQYYFYGQISYTTA